MINKVFNNYTGLNLKEALIRRNDVQTNYELRNGHTDIALAKPKREFLKKSFNYSGAKLWNSLPSDIKQAESIYSFKNLLKQNYIFGTHT